jgi:FeS assembly SUF system protein
MNQESEHTEVLQIETDIVKVLKNIYDPEIPVNIYDLGLIYDILIDDTKNVKIVMTLTAPNCPVADELLLEVKSKVADVSGVQGSEVQLVFDPAWDQTMMSEEALLELGML